MFWVYNISDATIIQLILDDEGCDANDDDDESDNDNDGDYIQKVCTFASVACSLFGCSNYNKWLGK